MRPPASAPAATPSLSKLLSEAGAWGSQFWAGHRGLPRRESPIADTLVAPLPPLDGARGELCAHVAARPGHPRLGKGLGKWA